MNKAFFGGTALIAGTCIGAGMLAQPVLTSLTGFIPSALLYTLSSAFMMATGLLFAEIALQMPPKTNLISMCQRTLKKRGVLIAWGLYLFLFESLLVAYLVGGSALLAELFPRLAVFSFENKLLIFTVLFSWPVVVGARAIDKLNAVLLLVMGFSYWIFVAKGFSKIEPARLEVANWSYCLSALPLIFTTFAYQGTVPTLVDYCKRDRFTVRRCIIVGCLIPLCVYLLWEALILGLVPAEALQEALASGQHAIVPLLAHSAGISGLSFAALVFAFSALLSSYFGVALSMWDFLADGLKVRSQLGLYILVFIPPVVIAWGNPGVFLTALHFGGGLGCALLLGLLPLLIAWKGYQKGIFQPIEMVGGKITYILLLLFIVIEIAVEIKQLIISY